MAAHYDLRSYYTCNMYTYNQNIFGSVSKGDHRSGTSFGFDITELIVFRFFPVGNIYFLLEQDCITESVGVGENRLS